MISLAAPLPPEVERRRARRLLGGYGAATIATVLLPRHVRAEASNILRVGPDGDVATIAEAARLAKDGDTVEVQAGEYRGDVAVWLQHRLTIRAVGGRSVLVADGQHAEGKGIWVVRDGDFTIEGFDFVGARVDAGNGAGIRFERGRLTVRDCRFLDNEMGLLTGNVESSELVVDRCEFSGPTVGTHWYHNLYVGLIGKFSITASWSHHARAGHLLKSRARESHVLYNRLMDEGGNASYELEFPNGGKARVVGNLIGQSPRSPNQAIVSFGAEGYRWPENELAVAYNTVVSLKPGTATFVRAAPGPAHAVILNNLWVGQGVLDLPVPTRESGNLQLRASAFRDPVAGDYRLANPGAIGPAGATVPPALVPQRQYAHERTTRSIARAKLHPGAVQR